jgi:predicted transcriptional regulator
VSFGYTVPVSAKQALREYVDGLSEDEAARVLAAVDDLFWERLPLTDDDVVALEEGLADLDAGRTHTTAEVRRHLGLDDR